MIIYIRGKINYKANCNHYFIIDWFGPKLYYYNPYALPYLVSIELLPYILLL